MDDVNYENFKVITSKIMLVKPKVCSPLKTDPYMVKIISRVSSDESRMRLYQTYTEARKQLRHYQGDNISPYLREVSPMVPVMTPIPAPSNQKSAFMT